jgi:predicted PurR-regulated permease PerM
MAAAPSTRDVVRITLTVAAVIAGLYLLYLVRDVLLLLFIAVFVAVALGPAVDLLDRRPRVPRAGAILLVYLGLVLVMAGIGLLVIPPVVDQANELARDAPGYVEDLQRNETLRNLDERYGIVDRLQEQAASLPERLGSAAGTLQSIATTVVNGTFQTVTILTVAFFLLLDGKRLSAFLLTLRGPRQAAHRSELAGRIYKSTAGYVTGAFSLAAINGTLSFIVLTVLGVPFAVPLGVTMAFFGLIPLVGATIGGVLVGLVTLVDDFPQSTIIWVIYLIVYQQLENSVLQPAIYRRTVNVPPLAVIVAILIGSALLGIVGALVAIPVAAAIQILARDAYERRMAARAATASTVSVSPPGIQPTSPPASRGPLR